MVLRRPPNLKSDAPLEVERISEVPQVDELSMKVVQGSASGRAKVCRCLVNSFFCLATQLIACFKL